MPARAAKKSTTPTKAAAKRDHRYDYADLAKASVTSSDTHHVYGVIIDATFPYKVNKDKYVCSVKVIDNSLHYKGAKAGDNGFATIVIYAKRFEDLPIVHRVGDILRVHRATLRLYKNHRQFNVSTQWNGSWALFSTDKQDALDTAHGDFVPSAFSGKKPTFEQHERQILGNLRAWARNWFRDHDGVTRDMYRPLNKAKSANSDFDVVARIVRIHEMDEYTNELQLRDASGESWHTLALKLKFPHLRQGSVVKIRSATYDETSLNKKMLVLQHYSNIMTFISSSKLASTLSQKVSDEKNSEKAALKSKVSMTPVVLTDIEKKHQNLPTTSLHDLFHSPDNSTSTFRTCFYVTQVQPGDVKECVKSYDKKTKKVSSAKGKGGELIYQVQFLVKDVSTQFNNNVYRILLYTHEGLGANFFPSKPANLHSDAKALGKVKDSLEQLTRFNSWVHAVVERRNGYYFIKDTKMIF